MLHRSLFFSKNMYEKRVFAEDRAAFAELSYNDHTGVDGLENFRDSWLNHCRLRGDLGEQVAYGIRLAGPGPAQRHCAKAASDAGRPIAALEAMLREQSPPPVRTASAGGAAPGGGGGPRDEEARAGKSRMNPAPSLHLLILLPQARPGLVSGTATSFWLSSAQRITLLQSRRARRAWPGRKPSAARGRRPSMGSVCPLPLSL